VSRTIR